MDNKQTLKETLKEYEWKVTDDLIKAMQNVIKASKRIKKETTKVILESLDEAGAPTELSSKTMSKILAMYERVNYCVIYENFLWFWSELYKQLKQLENENNENKETTTDSDGHSSV